VPFCKHKGERISRTPNPLANGTDDKYRTSPTSQDRALKLGISISEEFVLSVSRKVKHDRRGHVGQGSGGTPKEDSSLSPGISKVLGFWGRKNRIAEWGFRIVGLWVQKWPNRSSLTQSSPSLFLPNPQNVATE
jgi:hypothetical protein